MHNMQRVTGIKPGTSLWSFQTSLVFDTSVDTIIDISLWAYIPDHLTFLKTILWQGLSAKGVWASSPNCFWGTYRGNGPRAESRQTWKKKRTWQYFLQQHGLEKLKLYMFNIFRKLGIFSLLGCEFPTNGISLRKSVFVGQYVAEAIGQLCLGLAFFSFNFVK
jgi:hypothetical protein